MGKSFAVPLRLAISASIFVLSAQALPEKRISTAIANGKNKIWESQIQKIVAILLMAVIF